MDDTARGALGVDGSQWLWQDHALELLAGILCPPRGRFSWGETYGEGDWRELRQRLGVVSSSLRELMPDEEPALHTVISGKYAMIDLWGKPKSEDVKQAKRILRQIECLSLAHRPWSVLSQGERQRILIGRALMAGPVLFWMSPVLVWILPPGSIFFNFWNGSMACPRHLPLCW